MSDWNPIDTAPKDGKWILVCKPGMKEAWMVRWRSGKRVQHWETSHSFIGFQPTLWAPLPVPPEEGGA